MVACVGSHEAAKVIILTRREGRSVRVSIIHARGQGTCPRLKHRH